MSSLGALLILSSLGPACGKARIAPPNAPFPPVSRWEKALETPLNGALATDGTLVFAALSDGSVTALDPAQGNVVWTRPGTKPGFLAARPGSLVFIEKDGLAWGIDPQDGNGRWKTSTNVTGVQSVRLDGNRVFIGGVSGLASFLASSGELRFDQAAQDVRDIDAAGESVVAIEKNTLVLRNREDGVVRYRLESPAGDFGAPALFADGRVVLGVGSRTVRAVSPAGELKWRFKVGARVKHRPLDYQDGKRVGVLSFEGVFYELSLGGGDMRRRALLSSRPSGPPVLEGDRIWAPIFEDEIAVIDPKLAKVAGRARFGGSLLQPPLLAAGRIVAEVTSPRRLVSLQFNPLH